MKSGSSMRLASFQHGMRGAVASSTTVPIRQRSPISAPFTSIPRVVRFSPQLPGPSGRLSSDAHHSVSSPAWAWAAWPGPPCTLRSAWSSPSRFTPRTATRPLTGAFQIAVVVCSPLPRVMDRGLPTLTDTTVAMGGSLAHRPGVTAAGTLDAVATTAASVAEICAGAKRASRELARLDTVTKNAAIEAMADALESRVDQILEANVPDMEAGHEAELDASLLDRLLLTPERIAGIARDTRSVAALPDPVGETIDGHRMYNGLDLRRVRVPLGVV